MDANQIDLVTLRMEIRSTRRNMADVRIEHRSAPWSIAGKEFERLARLMEKLQTVHIQKTGRIYA
jgi:hypothetical protein